MKITSAFAWIKARLNKGPVASLVEKNMGPGYKRSKYGILWTRPNVVESRNKLPKVHQPKIQVVSHHLFLEGSVGIVADDVVDFPVFMDTL